VPFFCRGATHILRKCRIKVSNPIATPFSLVHSPGRSPSRLRLESTSVRWAVLTTLDEPEGDIEYVANRSGLVGGQGPRLTFAGGPDSVRRFYLTRSILVSNGTILEIGGNPSEGPPSLLMFRALGSTIARITSKAAGAVRQT
jgi:hypothetical protein